MSKTGQVTGMEGEGEGWKSPPPVRKRKKIPSYLKTIPLRCLHWTIPVVGDSCPREHFQRRTPILLPKFRVVQEMRHSLLSVSSGTNVNSITMPSFDFHFKVGRILLNLYPDFSVFLYDCSGKWNTNAGSRHFEEMLHKLNNSESSACPGIQCYTSEDTHQAVTAPLTGGIWHHQ